MWTVNCIVYSNVECRVYTYPLHSMDAACQFLPHEEATRSRVTLSAGTLYSVSIVYIVHSTVYTVIIKCTFYTPHYTLSLYSVDCTLYSVHCQYTEYSTEISGNEGQWLEIPAGVWRDSRISQHSMCEDPQIADSLDLWVFGESRLWRFPK